MKEDNPFNRFDSKPSSDSKNPFDQFDAPSAVVQAAPEAPKERGTYEKTKEGFLEVLPKDSPRILGPMAVGAAGELLKGGGAALELFAPETGKKVRETGRGIVGAVTERYPIAGTLGEIGSYALPYGAAVKGIQALRGAPAVSTLGKAAEAGGAGGAVGYATTGGDQSERILSGALGGALGFGTTIGLAAATKGYAYVADLAKKAFAGDAKKAADALRDYGSRRTGAEKQAAEEAARQAEQSVGIAETEAARQARMAEAGYAQLPGVKVQKEAGRLKPVPESEQMVGDRLRAQADKVYTDLKKVRADNAERIKGEAFSDALKKEQAGQKVSDTDAFKSTIKQIDDALRNPDTKLTNAPVQSVRQQLTQIKSALEGASVDPATGVVVGKPVSFEGMEQLRRFLNDRAYGLPAEGFDAISQQQAGKLAKAVEAAMEEFSPKIKTFINQYKADSEPLRVFQTRVGKLFDEQIPGVQGFVKVPSENIPSKVFQNRESYQDLIQALGGNPAAKTAAETEAQRYFVGQMEKLSGDPKKLETFIRDNRTMLNVTNARDMVEAYAARARIAAQRGAAAGARGEQAAEASKAAAAQSEKYKGLNLEFRAASKPQEVAAANQKLAQQLLDDKFISEEQYLRYIAQSDRISKSMSDASEAKKQLAYLAARTLGWGFLGGGAFTAIKSL